MPTTAANQIRKLFPIVVTICNPSNRNYLCLKNRISMSADNLAKLGRQNTKDLEIN